MQNITRDIPQLPLILGVVFGVAVAVIVIVVVSCFHCSCCLLYKKRQPTNGGPLYQMHCSSTASGVANMYSFSGTTTPSETPRSLSRASSRSHGTVESAGSVSSNHFDHRNLLDGEEPRPAVQTFSVDRRVLGPRPVSLNMSDRSSSISEGGPTDPPPPYSAPHSTLVAVRTSSAYALAATPRPPSPTYGHHNPYVISGGDSGYSSGPLATFPQTFLSPASPARPPPLRITSAMPQTFAPALTPTTRPCSTAHIIHTHHPGPDENLYTATKF
ncbi:serine/arginine repetitive matrix protein 2-like isoform X2 [Penaeus japonicus]|uniref:serine/arginine repetitive matrix protein 2-like isoform X2 n=1 Tax=Penaeus japonicus TaxID=27405 RepID=UPI001C713429|nr:serine/arginine repetitive matrix protein 2-like isoform X2 [Penaeus japonicus]